MKTGILIEHFNELFIYTTSGTFSLCKGSEEALQNYRNRAIGKKVRFVLLSSNKAACLNVFQD